MIKMMVSFIIGLFVKEKQHICDRDGVTMDELHEHIDELYKSYKSIMENHPYPIGNLGERADKNITQWKKSIEREDNASPLKELIRVIEKEIEMECSPARTIC